MTNEEFIKQLPRAQFAEKLIKQHEEPVYDYDCDDNLYTCGYLPHYTTSDGHDFCDDLDEAIVYECWWLAQERKE
jgi:hypothetical protein